jgi:hypothetical protein
MAAGETIAGIFYGGFDPIPTFFNRSVRQTDRGKLRQTLGCVHLHKYRVRLHTNDAHADYFNEHLAPSSNKILLEY